MDIFGPKPWKNVNFSTVWTFCSYILERHFFVLEYHKRLFPGLYWLKKKGWKTDSFGPKTWVNPFGKMSVFWLLKLLVFYSLKRRFFVLEYHKRHFPGLYWLGKKVGKMDIFEPKPWVNPFREKVIFRLFELLVFIGEKGDFLF